MNSLLTSNEVLDLINREYSTLGRARHSKFLRRGFNDHYLIGMDCEWYIFRIYLNHKYYIDDLDDFKFELNLLDFLHKQEIPVASAVQNNQGLTLGTIETPLGKRAFALFNYAQGDQIPMRSITSVQCYLIGETTAKLHLASNNFTSDLHRYHLNRQFLVDEPLKIIAKQRELVGEKISEQDYERLNSIIASIEPIEELIDIVQSLDVSGDEYGIIHSDLHPGNIHFANNEITLFDFDHCAYGWRAYDLAITEFMPENQKIEILKGYESVRPLSQNEKDCIPVFGKLRRLWDVGDSLAIDYVRAQE